MAEEKPTYEVGFDFSNPSPWKTQVGPWEHLLPAEVPKTVRYPEIPLYAIGREAARRFPHNLAIYYVNEERKLTYRELMFWSDKLANALAALGVKKGDGVGLYMINSPEFIIAVYGVLQTGAFVVPINPMLKPPEIEHIVNDCGLLTTVICSSGLYPFLKPVRDKVSFARVFVDGPKHPETDSIQELLEHYPAEPPRIAIDPKQDLCCLLYTGGTTGAAKGVMLTHYNITTNVYQMIGMEPSSAREEGVVSCLTVLPMCHAFGFSQVQLYIAQKAMMILNNGFDPPKIMALMERYRTENFVGIPLMFQLLINDPSFSKFDLSCLSRVMSGAAPLPAELAREWTRVTGAEVGQGYGLSEASPSTHMKPVWLKGIGDSIGIPLLDTDVRLVDPASPNRMVPVGEVGEMLIRGPQIMQGYWRNPQKTAETIRDGWLYTGDLARMDEKGCFFIAGRKSDMIKYKGYKVLPDEVEDALYQHPAIRECAVNGVPDPKIGETIKAFVVLREEYRGKLTTEELQAWAKQEMAGYKWPRLIALVESVPRTVIGKIDRKALRKMEAATNG